MEYNRNNNNMESMTALERSGYGIFREPKEKAISLASLWMEIACGIALFMVIAIAMTAVLLWWATIPV